MFHVDIWINFMSDEQRELFAKAWKRSRTRKNKHLLNIMMGDKNKYFGVPNESFRDLEYSGDGFGFGSAFFECHMWDNRIVGDFQYLRTKWSIGMKAISHVARYAFYTDCDDVYQIDPYDAKDFAEWFPRYDNYVLDTGGFIIDKSGFIVDDDKQPIGVLIDEWHYLPIGGEKLLPCRLFGNRVAYCPKR